MAFPSWTQLAPKVFVGREGFVGQAVHIHRFADRMAFAATRYQNVGVHDGVFKNILAHFQQLQRRVLFGKVVAGGLAVSNRSATICWT